MINIWVGSQSDILGLRGAIPTHLGSGTLYGDEVVEHVVHCMSHIQAKQAESDQDIWVTEGDVLNIIRVMVGVRDLEPEEVLIHFVRDDCHFPISIASNSQLTAWPNGFMDLMDNLLSDLLGIQCKPYSDGHILKYDRALGKIVSNPDYKGE